MQLSENAKLAVLLFVAMGYRATSNMLQTTIPLYLKYELHSSDFLISLIVTVAGVFAMLSLIYTTFRRSNVSKGLLLSLGMISLGLPLYLVAKNVIFFVIVTSFLYFWTGSMLVLLITAVVFISSGRTQERNIILFTAVLSLSLVLSPIFQASVLQFTSGNLTYSMASFAPLVILSVWLVSLVQIDNRSLVKGGFDLSLLKNRTFLLGILTNQIYALPYIALTTFGGIFARDRFAASYSNVEFLFTFFFVSSLVTRLLLLRLRNYRYAFVLSIICLTVAGLTLMYLSSSFAELAFGFVLLGYSHGLSYPIAANYIAESSPRDKLTTANSASSLIGQTVSLASLPIIGAIVESYGLASMFLVIVLPVMLLSIAYVGLSNGHMLNNILRQRFVRRV